MPLFYADASALVKAVLEELESDALKVFLVEAELISCELVLAEVPRAIRRGVADDPRLPLDELLARADEALAPVALIELDNQLLTSAGALGEPGLRTLDAIHVAAALTVAELAAFVSYDERQAAAARLAGLRTVAPGV